MLKQKFMPEKGAEHQHTPTSNMALRPTDRDTQLSGKTSDSLSEENSDISNDDSYDEKENSPLVKRIKLVDDEGDDDDDDDDDDDEDDDDKLETDDHHSDQPKQSKRKPSKSRIKRIIPQEMPDCLGLSPEGSYEPLPRVNSLMVGGSNFSHASMVGSQGHSFLQHLSGLPQRTAGGYRCEVCSKVFRVPSRYDSHMLSHSKGKPFCCDVCGKLFASQLKLDIHKPVHSRDRKESLECPTCGQKCNNWRSYLYHQTKHTSNGGKKHSCQVCGRQFHAAQRLRNHLRNHSDGKNFCCLICGKLFESQKRLDTHSLIHDAERQEPYSCVDCGKVYDDWRAFKQHMKTHGSDGVVYRCEICSAEFFTQYDKEKHKRVHTSDQRYQCSECSKCFRSQSQLFVHERKHLGNKCHECMICGREYARASSLKSHMKLHIGEEEFFCHICGRTFKRAEDLTAHVEGHVGDREFTCSQCGKAFAKKVHCHRHLVVHASGQPLVCSQCNKVFDQLSQLHAHILISHGASDQEGTDNQFPCLACSETFNSQLELEAHAHTHGKAPPFVCGLCGKLFAEQRYFRQHMKRHTARAMKKKMQMQRQGARRTTRGRGRPMLSSYQSTPTKTPTATPILTTSQIKLEHKCHMCGQQFAQRHSLLSHIEEHKRSGLFMYINTAFRGGKNPTAFQQRSQASDDESEDESNSEVSDETPQTTRSKTGTIDYSMKGGNANSHHQSSTMGKGGNNSSSSLTQAAERAMAVRMQAATGRQNSDESGSSGNANARPGVIQSSMSSHNSLGDGGESEDSQSYYSSAPVFPGQMSTGIHATPYHAAAQQFQNSHNDYGMDRRGSSQGGGRMGGYSSSSLQKGLPGFANFRHQLGFQDGYPEYPVSSMASSSDQFSPGGAYSSSSALPVSSTYLSAGSDMTPTYSSSSVPAYPDMCVFPGMPASRGDGDRLGPLGHSTPRPPAVGGGDVQQQYEPMLQFQPLGS